MKTSGCMECKCPGNVLWWAQNVPPGSPFKTPWLLGGLSAGTLSYQPFLGLPLSCRGAPHPWSTAWGWPKFTGRSRWDYGGWAISLQWRTALTVHSSSWALHWIGGGKLSHLDSFPPFHRSQSEGHFLTNTLQDNSVFQSDFCRTQPVTRTSLQVATEPTHSIFHFLNFCR